MPKQQGLEQNVPTQEQVRDLFDYEQETGLLRRRKAVRAPNGAAGTVVGGVHKRDRHRYIRLDGRTYRADQIVWLWHHGELLATSELFQRDGDYENDRIENLSVIPKMPDGGYVALDTSRDLTADLLRRVMDYDPESGRLTWKAKVGRSTRVGSEAGYVEKNGHRYINVFGVDHLAQRLAWLHVYGVWPSKLKFLDGDTSNMRIANLQEYRTIPREFDHRTPEGRAAYGKAHRKAHRDSYRDRALMATFGIGLSDYLKMHTAQGGVCAICRRPETMKRWGNDTPLAVDHDHKTGKVRGLLCSSCNAGIGRFQDNIEWLQSAIAYLRRHSDAPPVRVPVPQFERRSAYAGYH